jgi:hypothetical protein
MKFTLKRKPKYEAWGVSVDGEEPMVYFKDKPLAKKWLGYCTGRRGANMRKHPMRREVI